MMAPTTGFDGRFLVEFGDDGMLELGEELGHVVLDGFGFGQLGG